MEYTEIETAVSDLEASLKHCSGDTIIESRVGDEDGPDRIHFLNEVKDSASNDQFIEDNEDSSKSDSDRSSQVKTATQFLSIPHGLILRATYEHGKRHMDIMGVTYNERMRQFVILDSKGITTWKRDSVESRVHRALCYPKYEYRLITNMLYVKKYNCYFVLGKDFSLKVLSREFIETCSVNADLRSVLFMLFNPVRDELITGGVGGTKVWHFHQQPLNAFGDLKSNASYLLTLRYELPNVGGSWAKRVELDYHLGHLYFCSDHDLFTYDLEGKLLFKFERAHSMSITGCRYSSSSCVLVTSSLDSEVKVWSLNGGLVHTFREHSRAVTNLMLHPLTSSIVITCSLDGTVRMWSLETIDCLYSLVVSVDGIQWMGLTDDNLLYLSTPRTLTLWSLNYTEQFWALVRSQVTRMRRCGSEGKTTRILTVSEDSSVRLMSRSNSKCLSTVLPPPSISPLQRVISVSCSREFSTVYMLVNYHELWVYTTRTDPACRVAVWPMIDIHRCPIALHTGTTSSKTRRPVSLPHKAQLCDPIENTVVGNERPVKCNCTEVLTSYVVVRTSKGYCCPVRETFLLVGLEDGRIFFMDPVVKGRKFLEFKTGNDPVLDMYNDAANNGLITVHKLKGMTKILVWGVPDLTLQHEVYAEPDLRGFARESSTLVTGHENGCIMFHQLEPVDAVYRSRALTAYQEKAKVNHKPEHQAPVISIDVCVALKVFCSGSEDGNIKVWHDKVLLAEIAVDSSLSAVCFLGSNGDLLIGYQKHVFFIDHSKVCPQLAVTESDIDTFDTESYICEDPSVLYEGVASNQDHVTLENYLVPFDIDVSKNFLEGRVTLEPETKTEQVSDDENESQVSAAPTEIYLSPESTPRRGLSFVDLILSSKVSRNDLLAQMEKELDHVEEKEKAIKDQELSQHQMMAENRSREPKEQLKSKIQLAGNKSEKTNQKRNLRIIKTMETHKQNNLRFCFPRIGKSPSSSPDMSAPTTPEPFSGPEEQFQKVNVITDEVEVKLQPIEVFKLNDDAGEATTSLYSEERPQVKVPIETPKPKTKFGFNNIKVDAQTLMMETKRSAAIPMVPKRRPDPEVVQVKLAQETHSEKALSSRPAPNKKKMVKSSQRKNVKLNQQANYEPATQVQTVELKEEEIIEQRNSSLTEEDDKNNVMEEAEASVNSDENVRNKDVSVPNLKEAALENEEFPQTEISVPDLPFVPLAINTLSLARPVISKLKSTKSRHTVLQPVASFRGFSKTHEAKSESDGFGVSASSCWGDTSGALTAPLTAQMDYGSLVSEILTDATCSVKAGLLSDDSQGGISVQRNSSSTEVGRYDSFWAERDDISESEQNLSVLDLDTTGDLVEDRKSGTKTTLTLKELGKDKQLTSEAARTEGRQATFLGEGVLDKPEHENVVRYFKQRPHTAEMRFCTEDLQAVFDASVAKHKPTPRPLLEGERKDSWTFCDNWHERQIERHMLNRMQRELKQQKVLKRQQKLKHIQLENWVKHDTEDNCTVAESRHSSNPLLSNTTPRASTVHGNRPTINIPKHTPMPTRPHTASGVCGQYQPQPQNQSKPQPQNQSKPQPQNQSKPQPLNQSKPQPPNQSKPQPPNQSKPQSPNQSKPQPFMAMQQLQQQTRISPARFQRSGLDHEGQAEIKPDTYFRCKISNKQHTAHKEAVKLTSDRSVSVDPWLVDPRNPLAVRPKSSSSIPSKCHRFVLVNKPKATEEFPVPSTLEKYLLAIRFPQQSERIYRRAERILLSRSFFYPGNVAEYSRGQLFG